MAIRWTIRFIVCFLFILALLAVPLDLYLSSKDRSYLLDLEENQLKGKTHLALLLVKDKMGNPSAPDLQATAVEIGRYLGHRVTFISREGRILGDSHRNPQDPPGSEDLSFRPEILAAKAHGYGRAVRYSKDLRSEALFTVLAVEKEGKPVGYLRLASSLEPLERRRSTQRRVVYGTAGVVASLAVLLAFLMGRRLRRPLEELTDMVRGLEQGEFRQPFHLVNAFETQGLVSALESLANGLSEKMELLEKETGELKTLMAVMREGVLVTDEKGRIILINNFLNEVLGGRISWLRRSIQEAFMSADLQDAVDRVLQGVPFQRTRVTIGRENPRHFEVQVVALNPSKRQRRAVALFHETTELLHLLEVRRRFVANASWELEKPLSAIHSRLEALQPRIPEEMKDLQGEITSVRKEIRRLILLVSEMLDLAQLDVPDQTREKREQVKVRPLLLEAVEWVKEPAKEKGLTFEADLDKVPADTTALWERPRIIQALTHLLDNAVKYTPPGGKIRLAARRVQPPDRPGERGLGFEAREKADSETGSDFLEISVADTGTGIPKEHLPRIFERFYRVDREYSRRLGGTGLGLSIVKHIIEAHGGTVEVQSEPGKGSVFTVLIPLEGETKIPARRRMLPPSCQL